MKENMKHPKHEKTWRGQNKHAKNLKRDNLAWIYKDLEIWHNVAGQQTIGQRMNEGSKIKWMNEMTRDHGINLVLKKTLPKFDPTEMKYNSATL